MSKKLISLLTIAITLLNLLAVSAFAEAAVSVTVGNASGETGATVEIPVVLTGNTGFSSLGIEIGYDASAFELTGVTGASGVGANFTTAPDYKVNPYNMGWDSASNTSFNGTLATLKFKILTNKNGNYPITVDFYKGRDGNYTDGDDINYDENFNPLIMKYTNGCITVKNQSSGNNPSISVGGISFDITLEAENYSGNVIAALYSGEDALKCVKSYPAEESIRVSFDKGQTGAYVKIMWWEDLSSMKPVCNSQIIPLQ